MRRQIGSVNKIQQPLSLAIWFRRRNSLLSFYTDSWTVTENLATWSGAWKKQEHWWPKTFGEDACGVSGIAPRGKNVRASIAWESQEKNLPHLGKSIILFPSGSQYPSSRQMAGRRSRVPSSLDSCQAFLAIRYWEANFPLLATNHKFVS